MKAIMVIMPTPVTVVVLAAGLGTRMKSRQAKVLHRAGGKALVEHVVETALQVAPAERIFVVVGYQADRVREALAATGVGFIEQAEQKGTGHAVLAGREALSGLGGRLVVLYGDCPLLRTATLTGLVEASASGEAACVLLTAIMGDPTGYGRVIHGPDGRVTAIVEQKAGSPEQLSIREANMGIYCFRADLFWRHAGEMGTSNPAGEYYLTDMAEILSRAGHAVEAMRMDDPREALGINTRVELAEVDAILRGRKRRELMLAGVTIESPETVLIDGGVRVGMDTAIGPFVEIRGKTTIGENCRIGAHSIIFDSEIADGVEIGPYTIVGASVVERHAIVGPYARLRFGNHVGEGAHIGNFVELKKTRMGAGAKANHLAYLGDAEIGARSNIGAGTITCNYDGVHKHKTTIAEGVFVGSNATLVAPLEIGQGAYIAAGSVITQDVPPDALAVGRARQELKEGWAKKRRERRTPA
jgi:bifunctional UDP-N-acetylglucosamine pyrophosphorylase/glucosamine-1-phosphate N-acetyltransferase